MDGGETDRGEAESVPGRPEGRAWFGNGGGVAGRELRAGGKPEIPSDEMGRLGGGAPGVDGAMN